MNEIKVFINEDFGQIRAMDINGQPWFVGRDIATVLGYINPSKAVRTHVDDEDKGVNEMDTPGGKQKIIVINESGLYSLILSSKLPTAKKFKRWVTSEVLPEIRKYGGYIPGNSGPEVIANGMNIMDNKVSLIDNTEYIKAFLENSDRKIREKQPTFDLDPKAPVPFCWMTNYISSKKYNQITLEELMDVLYKLGFISKGKHNRIVGDLDRIVSLSNDKDWVKLTPAGFKELYYYFSGSKLIYTFKR